MNVYLPGARLPNTYQEVEYIQSSGTQYIDTGIINQWNTLNVDIKFMMTALESNVEKGVCGAKGGTTASNQSPTIFFSTSNHLSTWFGSGTIWNIISGATNTIYNVNHTFTTTNRYCTINGLSYSKTQSVANNANNQNGRIAIFADGSTPAAYSSMKLYYCKITVNGTLVRDFVPCYRKSDNVAGLYDLVNNQFYTNSGSGTFSKGNDVTMAVLQNAYIGEFVPYTPGANTIAYYPLNSTTTVNDTSGNSYNLTNNGSVTFGNVGGVNCATFSGSNYLSRSASLFTGNPTFTYNVWLRKTSTTSDAQNIVAIGSSNSTNSFIMWLYDNTNILYTGGWTNDRNTGYTPPLNTWINLGVSYANNVIRVYINGTQIFSDTLTSFTITSTSTNIGKGVSGNSGKKFYGNMSNMIFENKQWTATEISDYYNLTKSNYGL